MAFKCTFDAVAELYDAIRPRYPAVLINELVRQAGLGRRARLLEIAPGTGQATLLLAKMGYRITGVELGANMARIARERSKAYPNVEIVTASFEAAELPAAAFDLVYVATALHWIAPEARFQKSHALLKASGHLAIIHWHHVSHGQGDAFTTALQPIYQRYAQDVVAGARTYLPRLIGQLEPEPIDVVLFTQVSFGTFLQVVTCSAEDYVNCLTTYSPTLAMDLAVRTAMLEDIRRLIAVRFAGQVSQHYAMSLQIAQRK